MSIDKREGDSVSRSQPCGEASDDAEVFAGRNAELCAAEKPAPNPEWEAKADAAHAAIVAEVGEPNPFDTLIMLERWKAHAEPADQDGRISFSRAMLDSAHDALKVALEMARTEYLRALRAKGNFVSGAQECREMMARFVEQGGDPTTAASIRANWNPEWGPDPLAAADTSARSDRTRDEPDSLSALQGRVAELEAGLRKIDLFNLPLRYAEEGETDYFLRAIKYLKEIARALLKAKEG